MNSNAATNSVAFLGPNFGPKLPKTCHKPVHDGLSVLKTLIIFPFSPHFNRDECQQVAP
jgi:hypothetical protein